MMADSLASSILGVGKGLVELYYTGNKSSAEAQLPREVRLQAWITGTDGNKQEGTHAGERVLGGPRRTLRSFGIPRYSVVAEGPGSFISEKAEYYGNFRQGKFHDLSGNAKLDIQDRSGQFQKYVGVFQNGQRSGPGELQLYSVELQKYFTHFKGSWANDRPDSGCFYTPANEVAAEIQKGHYRLFQRPNLEQAQQSPINDFQTEDKIDEHTENSPDPETVPTEPTPPGDYSNDNQTTTGPKEESPRPTRFERMNRLPSRSPRTSPRESISPIPSQQQSARPLQKSLTDVFAEGLPDNIKDHPLIKEKIQNPKVKFCTEKSIDLLRACIAYGKRQEYMMKDKLAVVVIGNTGAGKSTFINYMAGCTMKMMKPSAIGLKGIEKVAVVVPPEKGGQLAEVMGIGHSKVSHTFIPDVAEADTIDDVLNGYVFVDCPGFLDNRGAEINIANAVNIRRHIMRSHTLKFVILINYHSLYAQRARGLQDLLTICINLFGGEENLGENINSLLLGISQVPVGAALQDLCDFILEDNSSDLITMLVGRLFIYDPEDRGSEEDGWSNRDQLRIKIAEMPGIEQRLAQIFGTVLVPEDLQFLLVVGDCLIGVVGRALARSDYGEVAARLAQLQDLTIIEHPAVERALGKVYFVVASHGHKLRDSVREHCYLERFDAADGTLTSLEELQQALCSLLDEDDQLNVDSLRDFLDECRAKAKQRQEQLAQLKMLKGKVAQLEEILRQTEVAKAAAAEQERQFQALMAELTQQHQASQEAQRQVVEDLRREMEEKFATKDEEVARARLLGGEAAAEEQRQKLEALEQAYRAQLAAAEAERRRLEEEQARERERREQERREQEEKAQREIKALEARVAAEQAAREREERREQELKKANAVTPEAFRKHCKEGRAAEVAAALEAVHGDPERLRALLEHRDRNVHTPLHDAAEWGRGEVVRLLLEAGADCDARDPHGCLGWTPMHQAAFNGHGEVVRLLLEAGADRDARDNDGRIPMHLAQNPSWHADKVGCAAVIEMLS